MTDYRLDPPDDGDRYDQPTTEVQCSTCSRLVTVTVTAAMSDADAPLMNALDLFNAERRPLGWSDAYTVDRRSVAMLLPYPWTAPGAGLFGLRPVDSVERKLSGYRESATISDKLAAWRGLVS